MECLLPYLCMMTVPHIMVGLERMLNCRGVGLARFHCTEIFFGLSSTVFLVITSFAFNSLQEIFRSFHQLEKEGQPFYPIFTLFPTEKGLM